MWDKQKPKWITFDCYGTLIDTKIGYVEIWRRLLSEKGLDQNAEIMNYVQAWGDEEFRLIQGPYKKYRQILIESVETTLKKGGLPIAGGDGERMANAWGTFKAFSDVKPALSLFKKHHKLAIISNVDNDIIDQSIKNIGIEFDAVFTAENCQAYKPSRIPFEYALKDMGVSPQEVLHVAFGYKHDHGTASAMGFMTIWVNRRNLELPPGARKFDLEMPDLSGLPALLGLSS